MKTGIREELAQERRMYVELECCDPADRAWLAVFPFKGEFLNPESALEDKGPYKFHVRRFQVPRYFIDGGYDVHDEELKQSERYFMKDLDSLMGLLKRWPESRMLNENPGDYPI